MRRARFVVDSRLRVLLRDLGVHPEDALRRAQLPRDLLNRPTVALTPPEYFALWHALEESVAEPALPVLIARALSPETFDPPIFAALCSRDLNQAAARIRAFKPLIGPLRIQLDQDERATTVTCRWGTSPEPPAGLALAELLFWVALVRLGTREAVRPAEVVTPHPPTDQAPYEAYLGTGISEGTHHAVRFAAGDAALPFLTADDEMWDLFEPALRRRLSQLDRDASVAERARAALLELLPAGQSSMRAVAGELAMSTRTLQRRLAEEDTSFQAVLATTREALARHYLLRENLKTAEISYLLGYADPSSFSRAFHDWTGQTPERVRSGAA